jgi:hypothetical protein
MLVPLLLSLAPQSPAPPDWVIPAGSTVFYDTAGGPLHVNSLTVQPGAYLRIVGPKPFLVVADSHIQIDGGVDASGFQAKAVGTLLTPFLAEPGALGSAGGGQGGTASPQTASSSALGGSGHVGRGMHVDPRGGRGGETGWSPSPDKNLRRGAGGGGGAFGPDELGGGAGLVAETGADGHPLGTGALSGTSPPKGGAINARPFADGDPANDFWGRKLDATTGAIAVGELALPAAGVGAGAGGDAIFGTSFPTIPFGPPYLDKKGAGGGGGGGLVVLVSPAIAIGATGSILADGGGGATGESLLGFDHIGGSSGGGSGGMIVLEAFAIDLSLANANALSARGGIGGVGEPAVGWSKGGNGGPGLIQLHVPSAAMLSLPAGTQLDALSAPNAHALLPQLL